MIRFIDLGDQILEGQREFAWWDTISDTFEEFNTNQAWETWEEFEADYRYDADLYDHPPLGDTRPLERYKGLFPKKWPPPFVSPEDRKKRYEKGICDDIVDCSVIPDRGKLVKMKEKLDKLLKKP